MRAVKTKFSIIIVGLLSVIICLAALGGTTYALFSTNKDAGTQAITVGVTETETETETAAFELVFENTDTYLYRIGNDDSVKLGSLFKDAYDDSEESDTASASADTAAASEDSETETTPNVAVDDASVSVTVTLHTTDNGYDKNDCSSALSATLTYDTSTWEDGTIAFNDYTGVVTVTIKADNAEECSLYLEVIDGENIESSDTLASGYSKNVILLADTEITAGDPSLSLSNMTLYGNGFEIDAKSGVTSSTYFGIVRLTSANLDNVAIIAAEYTNASNCFNSTDSYNTAAVRTSGNCTLTNCYIEGGNCALKVESVGASVTVSDSVFVGGCWANIEVKYGELIIEGTVITVNEPNSSVSTVGLGIVVGSPADLDYDACITIADDAVLTQYNWLSSSSDSSYFKVSYVSNIVSSAYSVAAVGSYVNAGIIFLNGNVEGSSGMPSGYTQKEATLSGYSGYIWTPTAIPSDGLAYRESTYSWSPSAEIPYEPTYTWTYPEETDTCVYSSENEVLTLTIGKSDSSVSLSNVTDIVSAVKHGQTLSVSVSASGEGTVTYSEDGDKLTFSAAGSYVITFTVEDPLVYKASSSRTGQAASHELTLDVTVAKASENVPSFTFIDEDENEYTGTVVSIGGSNYVTIADTTATGDNIVTNTSYSYTDSDGNTQYLTYTMVYGYGDNVDSTDYVRYLPIYKGIKISYTYTDDEGNEVTVNVSPTVTTAVDGYSMENNPTGLASNGWETSYTTYSSYYCRESKDLSTSSSNTNANITSDKTYDVLFSFTTPDTQTVYYFYIRYYYYAYDDDTGGYNNQYSVCLPSGTLITLADDSEVPVEDLTGDEELLVFDHETGEYTTSRILFIEYNGEADYEVTTLSFSDGSSTQLIVEHAYFDLTLNKYVYINEDTLYDYIGDEFVTGDGESISTVTLTDVSVETEYTGCYSLVTAYQLNYFVDGFLSIPGAIEGMFNIFEYGDGLKYDEELMAADIETYGLFTYEDLSDYVTEEMFEVFNGKYLKVAIGKGLITMERIEYLANYYGGYFEDDQ